MKEENTLRRQLIVDLVRTFYKLYPMEYWMNRESVKRKRGLLKDPKFGRSDKSSDSFKHLFRIPKRLFNSFDIVINNPRFLDEPGETEWFAKRFPEFKVPEYF